ncbi:MAG: helix-turn-helix domain-containing protein [Alphaproteobacteria bacterium]|jgi:DNA-binding winged helix-turn-helix (wHTH) protein|nr:helix-turn-helix domain-containing protein [Candidatus Jidaibacter sp.]
MKTIFLVNIEDETLISLDPKGMILEVRKSFSHTHYLSKERFAFLYFLAESRPHAVHYKQLKEIFDMIGVHFESRKMLDKEISNLKRELKSFGVHNLVVKVKKVGYCLSNKWISPEECTQEASKKRWDSLAKLVNIIVPMITKE